MGRSDQSERNIDGLSVGPIFTRSYDPRTRRVVGRFYAALHMSANDVVDGARSRRRIAVR
jgi:hypothetical protein